ncbi:16S rRNA (uracil(1498)-N(3))-methyltransferase [Candidatus Saganbacteria bacterium]|nr:16S rRNA (uracil(1498)-N(3))-methyltransferase [Candidatus Saganbacteria bacterium]
MPRFFVPRAALSNITGSDVHHIKNVLRLKPGDPIELCDSSGKVYDARILEINDDRINYRIISEKPTAAESPIKVTLAQCLPKGKKMDLIIQKATELGVAKIIPVLSERAISIGEKPARWQKIARAAAEQSNRAIIPEVRAAISFKDLLPLAENFDLALIPWELEKERTLKNILNKKKPAQILILIGPEGGFSQTEVKLAQAASFISITLGPRILRAETAGLAALAMINYQFGQ